LPVGINSDAIAAHRVNHDELGAAAGQSSREPGRAARA
jgi:hypothetical protein